MKAAKVFFEKTFISLRVHNYRLYFIGQGISQCGDWMQTVGMGLLVLQITGSGIALGTVYGLKYMPMFFGGFVGGGIVDRFNKRKILFITQSLLACASLSIAVLTVTHVVTISFIYIIAFATGVINTIDNPTRQTFIHELVRRERLRNALTLNSVEANLARIIGPLIAGTLAVVSGIALVFFFNALSFVAILVTLVYLRKHELHRETSTHAQSKIFDTFRYIWSTPLIRRLLIVMFVVGALSYEFQVSLILMAQKIFLGNALGYATLLSAMGVGAIVGGLLIAGRQKTSFKEFILTCGMFGLSMVVASSMPTLWLAALMMCFVGFFSIRLTSVGNTLIQLESKSHMRGRVVSLWTAALWGSTFFGAPIIGFIGQELGARWSLAAGGIAAILMILVSVL